MFEIGLNGLSAILDKAEAYAEAKRIDPTVLLTARLFPRCRRGEPPISVRRRPVHSAAAPAPAHGAPRAL